MSQRWYSVCNRNRTTPQFASPPLFLFHSITSTGSATAMKAFDEYCIERRGWSVSEKPNAVLDNPIGPVADFFNRFFINFKSTYDCHSQSVHMIWCHYLFGAHLFFSRPCTYITLLRDPVTQFISSVWFAHQSRKLPGLPKFEDWLEEFQNVMCHDIARVFCHTGAQRDLSEVPQLVQAKPDPETALRTAMENIDRYYSLVGITELFDETLFLCADHLGYLELPIWTRRMATPGRPKKEDLPERLLQKIQAVTASDQILYDSCRKKFEARFAAADFGPEYLDYKAAAQRHDQEDQTEKYWIPDSEHLHARNF